MTATALAQGPTTARTSPYRLGFGHVLRSEWIKFRSLRSTVWTLAITVVLMIGVALMFASTLSLISDSPEARQDPTMASIFSAAPIITFGYSFAQLVIAVLGALVITGEYSTGMIRSSFAAVPARLPVLWAKVAVVAVATFVLSAVGVALSYLATLPLLNANDVVLDLSDPEQLRVILGAPLYMATIAVLAVAVGTLLRHSAGAIFTLVALLFVIPMVFQILIATTGAAWAQDVNKFLPSVAGERVVALGQDPTLLEPWTGYAVLAAYAVVLLAVAAVTLKRRDA